MYKVDNYPEIKDNFFLKSRNIGASRTLKGTVDIMVCFMKRNPAEFSLSTQKQFIDAQIEACRWLQAEAKRYGTDLTFKIRHFTIDIPETASPSEGYNLIKEHFNSKTLSMDQLQEWCEDKYNVDETPFLLVFDESSRSFAHKQSTPDVIRNEISVVFKDKGKYKGATIAHELLHQFGAIDYYYPPEVKEYADLYIRDSIMGIGNKKAVDDLCAYLVGFKDTISGNTYHFLKKTMWITYDNYKKAVKNAWRTDNG